MKATGIIWKLKNPKALGPIVTPPIGRGTTRTNCCPTPALVFAAPSIPQLEISFLGCS